MSIAQIIPYPHFFVYFFVCTGYGDLRIPVMLDIQAETVFLSHPHIAPAVQMRDCIRRICQFI